VNRSDSLKRRLAGMRLLRFSERLGSVNVKNVTSAAILVVLGDTA
jgi:hypothetical protein